MNRQTLIGSACGVVATLAAVMLAGSGQPVTQDDAIRLLAETVMHLGDQVSVASSPIEKVYRGVIVCPATVLITSATLAEPIDPSRCTVTLLGPTQSISSLSSREGHAIVDELTATSITVRVNDFDNGPRYLSYEIVQYKR